MWWWQPDWETWREGPGTRDYHIDGQLCSDGVDRLWAVSGNSGRYVEEYRISSGESWRQIGELTQQRQKTGCVYDVYSNSLILPGGEVGDGIHGNKTNNIGMFSLTANKSSIADLKLGKVMSTCAVVKTKIKPL